MDEKDHIAQLEAELAEARSLLRISWGVVSEVGPQLRTATDIIIPAWRDTAAILRLWMLGWNLAAAGMSAAHATTKATLADVEARLLAAQGDATAMLQACIDVVDAMANEYAGHEEEDGERNNASTVLLAACWRLKQRGPQAGRTVAERVPLLEAVAKATKKLRMAMKSNGWVVATAGEDVDHALAALDEKGNKDANG